MEAIEIFREEERKMAAYRQDCIDSDREVGVVVRYGCGLEVVLLYIERSVYSIGKSLILFVALYAIFSIGTANAIFSSAVLVLLMCIVPTI